MNSLNLPPALNRILVSASAVALVATLAACSSSGGSSAASPSDVPAAASTRAVPESSASPSASIHLTVGVELAETWVSQPLAETGEGYGMSLTATSNPDLFDGHFFRKEKDGAVTDQHVITLVVTSRDGVEVTWPDGSSEVGTLALEEDGNDRTEIGLAPGCIAYLVDGGTDADCVLHPMKDDGTVTPPSLQAIATQDEAMSYICSVDPSELAQVTDASSDPFSTSILQAALTTLGYDPGPIDGRYGRGTKAAVRQFQSDSGVAVDALVGPQTWTSLQTEACTVPEDPAQPSD